MDIKDDLEPADQSVDLYSLLPNAVKDAINSVPEELLNLPEKQFCKIYEPNSNDRYIRMNLWNEYTRATRSGTKMISARIFHNVMTAGAFNAKFLANPHRVAFMLIPPHQYTLRMQNLLDRSLSKLEDILDMELTEKSAPTILKAALGIRDVVKGTAVQRNINVTADVSDSQKLTPDMIDKKIEELRGKLNKQPTVVEISEAENSDEEA